MSTNSSTLLETLHQANTNCRSDPDAASASLATSREKAADHFLETLLTSSEAQAALERECLSRAEAGQKTYRLTTWSGSGPSYCGQHLPDLLDLGNLLERMQDWLDETYKTDKHQFRIFNCRVRNAPRNTFNLIVSWNEEKFETADKIIENNRQMAMDRRDSYERRRQERQERDDGDEGEHGEQDEEEGEDTRPRRRFEGGREGGMRPRQYGDRDRDRDDRPRGPRPQRYEDGPSRPQRYENRDSREGAPPRRPRMDQDERGPRGPRGDDRPPRRSDYSAPERSDRPPRRTAPSYDA